jgi:hypothetical protein
MLHNVWHNDFEFLKRVDYRFLTYCAATGNLIYCFLNTQIHCTIKCTKSQKIAFNTYFCINKYQAITATWYHIWSWEMQLHMTLYPCACNFTTCTWRQFLEQHRKYCIVLTQLVHKCRLWYTQSNAKWHYMQIHIMSQHEHQEISFTT